MAMEVLNRKENPLPDYRSLDCFEIMKVVGQGAFSKVYMAKDKLTHQTVALKKLNDYHGDFPITSLDEITILTSLSPHPNIIQLREVAIQEEAHAHKNTNKHNIVAAYLVLEYMDHDLSAFWHRPGLKLCIAQIKHFMKQLLRAVHHCHQFKILHRDIKTANVLVNKIGVLKLADFGLARCIKAKEGEELSSLKRRLSRRKENIQLTDGIGTLWYRAPELLLGSTKYGTAVDIWSVGCVFAELLSNGKPLFTGSDEKDQMQRISEVCGSPKESDWPGVTKLPQHCVNKPSPRKPRKLRELFDHLDRASLDLLDGMLKLNPLQRISAADALNSEYFGCMNLALSLPRSLSEHKSCHLPKRKREAHEEVDATKLRRTLRQV